MRPPRIGDQYLLRLPAGMRERLAQRAAENRRPVKAEIIQALEEYLAGSQSLPARVARIEAHLGIGSDEIRALRDDLTMARAAWNNEIARRTAAEVRLKGDAA